MVKEDLRIKLQSLLSSFKEDHKLDDDEVHTIAATIATLMYSDKESRLIWYREMQKTAQMISNYLRREAEAMMEMLNLSDEEKRKLIKQAKDPKKVEN